MLGGVDTAAAALGEGEGCQAQQVLGGVVGHVGMADADACAQVGLNLLDGYGGSNAVLDAACLLVEAVCIERLASDHHALRAVPDAQHGVHGEAFEHAVAQLPTECLADADPVQANDIVDPLQGDEIDGCRFFAAQQVGEVIQQGMPVGQGGYRVFERHPADGFGALVDEILQQRGAVLTLLEQEAKLQCVADAVHDLLRVERLA